MDTGSQPESESLNDHHQLDLLTTEEIQNLVDALPDATLGISDEGAIKWFNVAAQSIMGLKNPGDLGLSLTSIIRDPDFADWLDAPGELSQDFEMPSPGDDNIWLNVSKVPYGDEQRMLIFRDISDIHNVDKLRRDFVANISHELRTPLTVLVGYLEVLQEEASGAHTGIMDRMYTQARQMKAMLDDLLELSRLERKDASAEVDLVDVPSMLIRLNRQAEEISAEGHQLEFRIEDELCLLGVKKDIESAFRNIIFNALHYTPAGGSIQVSWEKWHDGARLRVRDSGIGIPSRDIPRLTERFYRVGSDRARNTGGTGLGLSIVKHVLKAHDSRLNISSELGVGSEFVCQFPSERTTAKGPDTNNSGAVSSP
jgi:two-component system phosphate regulon sensor histidine kinase PhoR